MTSGKTDIQTFHCLFTYSFVSRVSDYPQEVRHVFGAVVHPLANYHLGTPHRLWSRTIVVYGSLVCMAFIDIQPLSQDGLENGERVQSEASDSLLPRLWAFILIGGNISIATCFERMYSCGDASAHGYLAIYPFLRYQATPLKTY